MMLSYPVCYSFNSVEYVRCLYKKKYVYFDHCIRNTSAKMSSCYRLGVPTLQPVTIILTCLSLICFPTTRASPEHIYSEAIQFSKYLTGLDPFRVFHGVSHKHCRSECLSRNVCKSYNFHRRLSFCGLNLNDANSPFVELRNEQGYVFSQKMDWQVRTISPRCSVCPNGTVCDISGLIQDMCKIRECLDDPPHISGTKHVGNIGEVGSKVSYDCIESHHYINGSRISICNKNGIWTKPDLLCVHRNCFESSLRPNTSIVMVGKQTVYYTTHCPKPLVVRGDPVTCTVTTGKHNFNTSCCDQPDTDNWKKILRMRTNGNVSPYRFWKDESIQSGEYNFQECQFREIDVIKNWTRLAVKEVKLEVFENNTLAELVIFDGVDSTSESWFGKEKVVNTSWTDLKNSDVTLEFKPGPRYANPIKYSKVWFVIAHNITIDCSTNIGWFYIEKTNVCFSANTTDKPFIFYAPHHTMATRTSDFRMADKIEISVKFEESRDAVLEDTSETDHKTV